MGSKKVGFHWERGSVGVVRVLFKYEGEPYGHKKTSPVGRL